MENYNYNNQKDFSIGSHDCNHNLNNFDLGGLLDKVIPGARESVAGAIDKVTHASDSVTQAQDAIANANKISSFVVNHWIKLCLIAFAIIVIGGIVANKITK